MVEDHLKVRLRITIKSKVPALVQIPNLLQGSGGCGLKAASFYSLPTPNLGLSQGWPSGGWPLEVLPENKSRGSSLLSLSI